MKVSLAHGSLGVDLVELQTHGNLCRSHVRVVRARASEASTLLIQERVEIVRRNLGRFVFHGELSAEAICDSGSKVGLRERRLLAARH